MREGPVLAQFAKVRDNYANCDMTRLSKRIGLQCTKTLVSHPAVDPEAYFDRMYQTHVVQIIIISCPGSVNELSLHQLRGTYKFACG